MLCFLLISSTNKRFKPLRLSTIMLVILIFIHVLVLVVCSDYGCVVVVGSGSSHSLHHQSVAHDRWIRQVSESGGEGMRERRDDGGCGSFLITTNCLVFICFFICLFVAISGCFSPVLRRSLRSSNKTNDNVFRPNSPISLYYTSTIGTIIP